MINKKKPYYNLIQLDLTTKYDEMLRVNCRHEYFSNRALGGLELLPTAETEDTLKRLQMVYRQDWGGFSLGYASRPGYIPVELIDSPVRLSFWLFLGDNYFYNYTDIPYEVSAPLIYHFSNRAEGKDEEAFNGLHLSKGKVVSGDDRVEIRSHQFNYEFADTLFDDVLVQVLDNTGAVFFEAEVEAFSMDVDINLFDAPSGFYHIKVGDTVEDSFYIYPSDLRRLFGVIDIVLDPKDLSPYTLLEGGKVSKKDYTLYFNTRGIRWKYIVVEQSNTKLHSDFKILENIRGMRRKEMVTDVTFTKPEEIILDSGLKGVMMYSEKIIPLREQQEEKFKLRTKRGKNKVEHLTELPCPSAKSNLKIGENQDFFSEIVVYL